MTWLTWRLHRTEAAIGLPLFAALIVILLLAGSTVDAAYDSAQDANCFASGQDVRCSELITDFYDTLNRWDSLTVLLHGIPLAVAALLAIPTLQELERGSHRLAWTQSVSRGRWVLWRLAFVVGIAAAVTAVWVAVAAAWGDMVLREAAGTFSQDAFDLSPAVLIGYGVFAVALALAAAVVIRRVVPTLAVLAVGFIGARVFTAFQLRERYRNPVEERIPAAEEADQLAAFADRWLLDESWLSRSGERLSWERVYALCNPAGSENAGDDAYQRCLVDNGLQYYRAYHPADRFAQFQLIETALYLGLAAALLAFAYWWLTRRAA